MKTWKRIVEILSEDKQYRGDTFVSLGDLRKLGGKAGFTPDPQGGFANVNYPFLPDFLNLGDTKATMGGWYEELDTALVNATTASAKEISAGMGSGGLMTKGNYGGKVQNSPAPKQPHHNDRLGSTMDRYDVIIVADFDARMNKKGMMVPHTVMKRIAWAPSMGSQEERAARLQSLLAGRPIDLPRRAQGERPTRTSDDEENDRKKLAMAAALQGSSDGGDDDENPKLGGRGGGATNSDFAARLAKMNKDYKAPPQRSSDEPSGPGLFPDMQDEPTTHRRMSGPNPVKSYPGGLATDRDKLRRIRNLPKPKIPADED